MTVLQTLVRLFCGNAYDCFRKEILNSVANACISLRTRLNCLRQRNFEHALRPSANLFATFYKPWRNPKFATFASIRRSVWYPLNISFPCKIKNCTYCTMYMNINTRYTHFTYRPIYTFIHNLSFCQELLHLFIYFTYLHWHICTKWHLENNCTTCRLCLFLLYTIIHVYIKVLEGKMWTFYNSHIKLIYIVCTV